MHQGWPKFVKSLVMGTTDGGLAVVAYGPCVARTTVGDGMPVELVVETAYPFDETVEVRVGVERPVAFPLVLRIPAWASGAQLTVEGETVAVTAGRVCAGGTHVAGRGAGAGLCCRWRCGRSVGMRG